MKSLSRLAVLALMLGAFCVPARAADIITKGPPATAFSGFPYSTSGFYGGLGAVASVLSASVGGDNGGTSLYSAGAALDLTAGYQFVVGGNWYAIEGSAQYTNMGGAVACSGGVSCVISSRWGFEQRGLIGFPIQTVLSVMPNLNNFFPGLPALPGGVTATSTANHPYVFAGLREDDISAAYGLTSAQTWKIQPVVGVGIRQQWTNGLVVDTSAGCTFANTGIQIGGPANASATYGRDCRAALRFLY